MNATNLENNQPAKAQLPRLAFSLQETAEMLGVSYITIWRLVQRGKLKSSGPLRTKLITQTEINRFLNAEAA
jgi:excisionase family DNA binding protein